MERYESLGPLGEGSYGTVVKCRHRDSGRLVAIKKFLDSDDDRTVKKIALREIKLLRQLRHDNLVNLLEVWKRRRRWYLVFEFVDRTLLDDLEQNPSGLDLNTSRRYLYQILRAAAFCHQQNIIHRDIKPENVLISLGGVVKLCDFGFARTVVSPSEGGVYTDYVATRWYRAPELLVGDIQYGKPVDVWAIGCLLMETLTGQPLFPGDSDLDQIHHIVRCFGNLTPRHQEMFHRNPVFSGVRLPESSGRVSLQQRFRVMPPMALDLAQSCLEVDPEKRAQCSELLEHPLFTQDSFHIRFVDELNAKIQKGHRENSTLPKITKTLKQERDGDDERRRRTRDKKHNEELNQRVNKDRTKEKPDTKTSRAEPQSKQSRSVPGQSWKNRQGKVKPPTCDLLDPSEQAHEKLEDCPKVGKDIESTGKRAENKLNEPSRSLKSEKKPEFGKNWNLTEVPKLSRDPPLESVRKPTNQISHVDPVETKTASEDRTRAESRENDSPEVKPLNNTMTKTAGPNQTCSALYEVPPFCVPVQSATEPAEPPQRPTDPNTFRTDQISKKLPKKRELTQDLGGTQVPAASGGSHQEDLRSKVATQLRTRSPSRQCENTPERTTRLRTLAVSDKENHKDSTTTKSKPSREERSSNRSDVTLVVKSLKVPHPKGLVKPDFFKSAATSKTRTNMADVVDPTSGRSAQDHKPSARTSNTADLQVEGLNPPPPPPTSTPLPPPTPHHSPDPAACSPADSCPTPVGFHAGTSGLRCAEKLSRRHGSVPTRQSQQLVSVHAGGLMSRERPLLSDRCNLRVGGSSVTAEKNKTHFHFPDLRKAVVTELKSREGKHNNSSTKDQRRKKRPVHSSGEPQYVGPDSTDTETQTD